MKTVPATLVRLAAGVLVTVALATPAPAQTRHRIVKRPSGAEATLSGVVIDSVTRAPLGEAFVKAGNKSVGTLADGRFSFTGLTANTYEVTVTRWGYLQSTRSVTLVAGDNQLEVALQPAPIVTVRAKNGTTVPLDFDSVEFGYFVAFVGFSGGRHLNVCLPPAGEESRVTTSEMKSVTFPGVRTETSTCCSLAPGLIARITKHDSSVVEPTIRESCNGSEFFVRGRNRTTGASEAIKLTDVESVTF